MEHLSYEVIQNMSERECEKLFFRLRWPDGFVCPRCQGRHGKKIPGRKLWRCTACQAQVSLKSGTILHGSHLSIKKWLLALALLSEEKGISAKGLQKRFEVSYETAWLLLHKIRQAIRKGHNKVFSCLIATTFLLPGIQKIQKQSGGPYPVVETEQEGEMSFAKLTLLLSKAGNRFGLLHGSDYLAGKRVVFSLPDWVHVMMDKARELLSTTYHYGCRKHMQRYLDEFSYRWNTRREKRIAGILLSLVCCGPRTYREFVEEGMVLVA
ncbi:MAG: transposase [Brevinematales bacterium]